MPIKMSNHRVADSAHGNKHNACEDFELRFFEAVRDGPRRYEKKTLRSVECRRIGCGFVNREHQTIRIQKGKNGRQKGISGASSATCRSCFRNSPQNQG